MFCSHDVTKCNIWIYNIIYLYIQHVLYVYIYVCICVCVIVCVHFMSVDTAAFMALSMLPPYMSMSSVWLAEHTPTVPSSISPWLSLTNMTYHSRHASFGSYCKGSDNSKAIFWILMIAVTFWWEAWSSWWWLMLALPPIHPDSCPKVLLGWMAGQLGSQDRGESCFTTLWAQPTARSYGTPSLKARAIGHSIEAVAVARIDPPHPHT